MHRASLAARRYLGATGLAAFIACAAALCVPTGFAGGGRQEAESPKTASDIVVVGEGPQAGTVFLADADSGGLFFMKVPSAGTTRLPFSEFRPFLPRGAVGSPASLAYARGKLYVGDEDRDTLFEVDLETRAVRQVGRGGLLVGLKTIAVSESGQIATTGDDQKRVVLISPAGQPALVEHSFDDIRRLLYYASSLLVLDGDGHLFSFEGEKQSPVEMRLPPGVGEALDKGEDFALYRNIYYVAAGGRVIVFAQNRSGYYRWFDAAQEITFAGAAGMEPSRLHATESSLFVADNRNDAVWQLPRPVPVDVRFGGDAQSTNAAAVELLSYLDGRQALRARPAPTPAPQGSVERLLVEGRVLVRPISGAAAVPARARLGGLICKFNREFCERNKATPESVLGKNVGPGESLSLPDFSLGEYVTPVVVTLSGKSVEDLLSEIFPTPDERTRYASRERLERLNPPDMNAPRSGDLLRLGKGKVVLPVKRWQTSLLVPADELKNGSTLRALDEALIDMHVLSKEDFPSQGASAAWPRDADASQADDTRKVEDNRTKLKREIHYPDFDFFDAFNIDATDIIVGVAESPTVDVTHPAFVNPNGESVWFEVTPGGDDVLRHPLDPNAPPPAQNIDRPCEEGDHATHVAGLIAARGSTLAPGLVHPVKGLLLVDKSNPAIMHSLIDAARLAGPVRIYNLSFSTPVDELSLKQNFLTKWKECLFVVAAGNALGISPPEQDLGLKSFFPVAWADRVQNMIGVAAGVATDAGEIVLMTPFVKDGVDQPGSKFSKRFVHLIAPGRAIFSLGRANSYKSCTGTSQAAPQVTAAAAMLYAQGVTSPTVIKARLMYTSDWYATLQNKVYGGALNVRRAVWLPGSNLISMRAAPTLISSVLIDTNPTVVVEGQMDDPAEDELMPESRLLIKFRRILRVTPQPGQANLSRVFFLDCTDKLRVMNNATVSGKLKCTSTRLWNEASRTFGPQQTCGEIEFADVADYVASVKDATNVKF
jgi:hypothetical protein